MELLRARGDRPTAELWAELLEREPTLEPSVARNTLRHLERRGYVEGTTYYVPNAPGGRQRRWSLTELGGRVIERFARIRAAEERLAA